MKTKHLLFATALVASLAACTNDDFIVDKQLPVADGGRPTVSDVKLNFTGDAETRLAYNGKYAWEATDTIGALLMDNVTDLSAETWLGKYTLVSNIHTSYPFTYNSADNTWGCNTKMLEGNYFFAYPWESYDGNRQVRHSLINQQQNGVGSNVVAESLAKNQFFIGYSQIKAGTDAKEALNDVEMTSVLGAIQLRIVNTGTQTYHINKIVLSGTGLCSVMTFDPTEAAYTEDNTNYFNLSDNVTFNYANYTGNTKDVNGNGDFVYNADKHPDYDRMTALRKVAQKLTGSESSAQLIINGTEAKRALVSTATNANAVAYALIMANAHEVSDLELSIYTDEGMVGGIDLTQVNEEVGGKGSTAITSALVKEIGPGIANTIRVQIDDNSFNVPTQMNIFNSEDLLQFIKWNGQEVGTRNVKATLKEDVTLTKKMLDLLKTNVNLTIAGSNVLTLAEDVPADVLDRDKLDITTEVEVTNALTLTSKSDAVSKITVAEGATLNINTVDAVIPTTVENNGTLAIGENAKVANTVTIKNNATMTVAKGGDVKANTTNYGTLENGGYVTNVTNKADAEIVMGEGSILMSSTNEADALITTAKDAQVQLTANNGEVKYVEGAYILPGSGNGVVSTEVNGTVNKTTFDKETIGTAITKLILKPGVTNIADDLTLADVTVADGAILNVATGKTLKVTNLDIEGTASLTGTINVTTELTVEKGASLTVSKDATVTATTITNNGVVYNNGTVKAGNYEDVNKTSWKYNEAQEITAPVVTTTYKLAVAIDEQGNATADYTTLTGDAANAIEVTFASLKDLNDYMSQSGDFENVDFPENVEIEIKSITISSDLTLSTAVDADGEPNGDNHYTYLKTWASGKEVILEADLSGLTNAMGMSFGTLTVSEEATVESAANAALTILTVSKINLNAELTITGGHIQLNEAGAANKGTANVVVSGGSIASSTGKIVDNTGAYSYEGSKSAMWQWVKIEN